MLDFSYEVQDKIKSDFIDFISNINSHIYENGRSLEEYYKVIRKLEKEIEDSIIDYKEDYSINIIGLVIRFHCGEEMESKAKMLILDIIDFVEFSESGENKVELSIEEFELEVKAKIIAESEKMSNYLLESDNFIDQYMAAMYTLIAKNISTGEHKQTEVNNDVKGIDKLRANVNKAIEEQKRSKEGLDALKSPVKRLLDD